MRSVPAVFAFVCALTAWQPAIVRADGRPGGPPIMLAFQTMYGVDGPFLGDANKIRDVEGDEAPWEIGPVTGKLFVDGTLLLVVRHLVFKDSPLVQPPSLIGTNDEPTFRALVSCLTEVGEDKVETRNIVSKEFPATQSGNSFIKTKLELPNPCVAPIVFVLAGSEDKWFAVTGFEAEEKATDHSPHK